MDSAKSSNATFLSIAWMMEIFNFDLFAMVRTLRSSGLSMSFSSTCRLINATNSAPNLVAFPIPTPGMLINSSILMKYKIKFKPIALSEFRSHP